jgi:hypothetical protein
MLQNHADLGTEQRADLLAFGIRHDPGRVPGRDRESSEAARPSILEIVEADPMSTAGKLLIEISRHPPRIHEITPRRFEVRVAGWTANALPVRSAIEEDRHVAALHLDLVT